jgi:hypothetical protein
LEDLVILKKLSQRLAECWESIAVEITIESRSKNRSILTLTDNPQDGVYPKNLVAFDF